MPASLPTPHAADAMAAVEVLNFHGCERLTAFGTRWCRRRRGRCRLRDRRRRLGGGFARQQFSAQMRQGMRTIASDKCDHALADATEQIGKAAYRDRMRTSG